MYDVSGPANTVKASPSATVAAVAQVIGRGSFVVVVTA